MARNRTKADRQSAQKGQSGRNARSGQKVARASRPSPSVGPSGLPLLRTSERSTFKRCRWLWWIEYDQLLKPNQASPPLMLGSMIHIAMAKFYKPGIRRGPHPRPTFETACYAEAARIAKLSKLTERELIEDWSERIELGVAMLDNYVETYGKDEETKVLVTEFPFRCIVQKPNGIPWFWYVGILDNVIENRSTLKRFIRDHKTASAIDTKYLALDDQATAYWKWGVEALYNGRMLNPGEKLNGIEFNFLRKQKPDERNWIMEEGRKYYTNLDGSISKKQPAPYFQRHIVWRQDPERERALIAVRAEFSDIQAVRKESADDGLPGAYKTPRRENCNGCWAFDMCEMNDIQRDWRELAALSTHTWDPYAEHEIYFGDTR